MFTRIENLSPEALEGKFRSMGAPDELILKAKDWKKWEIWYGERANGPWFREYDETDPAMRKNVMMLRLWSKSAKIVTLLNFMLQVMLNRMDKRVQKHIFNEDVRPNVFLFDLKDGANEEKYRVPHTALMQSRKDAAVAEWRESG